MMDNYHSDLATSSLSEAIKELTKARQYAADANAPTWLLDNLKRMSHGIQNRINDILALRKPRNS